MAKRDVWTFNFASLPKVRERIENYFKEKTSALRDQREVLEDEWMRFTNMWNVEHDQHHQYRGNSELYIPEVRKNVESQARQLTEAQFPNGNDVMDVVPGRAGTKKGAVIQKSVRQWQIHQAGLRMEMHVFNRQACLLGTSPAFVPWVKKEQNVFRRKLAKDRKNIETGREKIELFNGPEFITRDLFKWYALNPKKKDFREDGCFEIAVLNEFDLRRRDKKGNLNDLKEIIESASDVNALEELEKDVERMERMGLTVSDQGYAGVATLEDDTASEDKLYLSTLIFTNINLPEATESDEDPKQPIPVMIELINGRATLIKRNPFWHQTPPYVVGKYIQPNSDFFYGQGIPKAIQFMQYEINSKAEQSMDSATLALNPLAIVDPGLAGHANDFVVEPGGVWFASPEGIKFQTIPDVSATGYQAIGLLRGQMQEYSDRAPALPPQLAGKSRSATQSAIVNSAIQVDLKSFLLNSEIQVLSPLMEMWESLTEQNIDEDQVIMIMGRDSKEWRRALVPLSASLGRYKYFWKGSSNLQDKAILGRSIVDMLKVAGSMPPEAQANLNLNYTEIYRMLWTDAFQLPNADKLFGQRDAESTDPELEHEMLNLGVDIEVLPGDDDSDHLAKHSQYLESAKGSRLAYMEAHMEKHREQAQAKIAALQAQIQQRQAFLQAAVLQGVGDGRQGNEPGRSRGSGNRSQLSPLGTSGDVASGVRA